MPDAKAICALAAIMLAPIAVAAQENKVPCPNQMPCKVIVVTEDEEKTLTGQGMIFDAAEWANKMNFSSLVAAWKQKIATSPQGEVKKIEEKK